MKRLAIPPDANPEAPGDNVVATGLITDLALLPGWWAARGYDGMIARLRSDNGLAKDQVVGFPYDWRLSSAVNGQLLATFLDEQLDRWRTRSGRSKAQAVLIAHSMGGLVARWCIEKEGGSEVVSRLFTIGTPYKGSAKALDALYNGVRLPRRIGPRFDDLVQSLPSVRELLPTYPCVRVPGATGLVRLDDTDILPRQWVEDGRRFQDQLATAVAGRARSRTDDVVPFRNGVQPTLTTAELGTDGSLTMFESVDARAQGRKDKGDGTVPRDSACPPEWGPQQLVTAKAVSQRHASMQLSDPVLVELAVILSDAGQRLGTRAEVALRAPAVAPAGERVEVAVEGRRSLDLQVVVTPVDGSSTPTVRPLLGDGPVYHSRLPELGPGVYEIAVVGQPGQSLPVEPVTDYLSVFEDLEAPDR